MALRKIIKKNRPNILACEKFLLNLQRENNNKTKTIIYYEKNYHSLP